MPSAFPPEPEGSGPADQAAAPADDSYVSEFLSEFSPEIDATRPAASDTPPPQATTPRNPPEVVPPVVVAAPAVVPAVVTLPTIMRRARTGRAFWRWLTMAAGLTVMVVAGTWFVQERRAAGTAAPAAGPEGTATIVSRPAGAEVFIDGESRGITPLRLSLPVGEYAMELRNGAATRSLTLTIEAATAVRETVDLEPSAALGRLEVRTDVDGAYVSVDGVLRGVTPLVVSDLAPGQHRIAISRGDVTVSRTATVQAGSTAAIVASVVPPRPSGGWLTFQSPIEMQVMEGGELLGTTRDGRISVPAGRHNLQLVADPYGFRTTATAVVTAGQTVNMLVTIPDGRLSIDAVPRADVWLNGQPLGPTPHANMAVPIGDHEVVWRHPDLGERRQSVRVTATTPARVDVNLNQ